MFISRSKVLGERVMSNGKLIPSVCIDAVLGDQSIDEALKIVSKAGYSAFEFWCWWEKDLTEVMRAKDKFDLSIAAFCTKFISLVDPELRDDYLRALDESIQTAKLLGCENLISQVGDFIPGQSREIQHQSLVDGLIAAAPMLEASGINLVIEPLNEKVDHPGYYLIQSDEAFHIVDEVASSNVKVVFDIYHQQISEGNLIPNITKNIDKIGHFHAAGHPGRNELNRGEINYPEVFAAINKAGYCGHVGLEYWPTRPPIEGLELARGSF